MPAANALLGICSPSFEGLDGESVLDVGAGTGNYNKIMPAGIGYIWLDSDPQKLRGFRAKRLPGMMILGDAARIPLRDRSVDVALCFAMSHHLTDEEVSALFRELARLCRKTVIFMDAVDEPGSFASRLLWKYDRGSRPRTVATLRELITGSFNLTYTEQFKIYHSYVLWVGEPKNPVPDYNRKR